MKAFLVTVSVCVFASLAHAEEEEKTREEIQAGLDEGTSVVADEQDELSADVQQLVIEQTVPKVITLLSEVEDIMDEAIDRLVESDTGGETLAAQTEVIEKIHEAAKEKQKQGGSPSGSAMMDMMERMMGKTPGEGKGKGKGDKPGDSGGEGQTGLSDAANEATGGPGGGNTEVRRVPKASGNSSLEIPAEFRKALDAYNRGAEVKIK